MKMSEVFKLPIREEALGSIAEDKQKQIDAVIKAVNSYDTQLADICRLLDGLKTFDRRVIEEDIGDPITR